MSTITEQLKATADEFLAKTAKKLVEDARSALTARSAITGSFTPCIRITYAGEEHEHLISLVLDLLPPDIVVSLSETKPGEVCPVHLLDFDIVPMGNGGNRPYDFFTLYIDSEGLPQDNYAHMKSLNLSDSAGEQYKTLKAYEAASQHLLEIRGDDWDGYVMFTHHVLCWVVANPGHDLKSLEPVARAYYTDEDEELELADIFGFLSRLNRSAPFWTGGLTKVV